MSLASAFKGFFKNKDELLSPSLKIANLHNIGTREDQQDSFGISDISDSGLYNQKGVLAVVADGMGGLACGAVLSALVTTCMLEQFTQALPLLNPANELAELTAETVSKVNRYLEENHAQGGSTMVAAIVRDGLLYFLSVGDSRICLMRNGAFFQLNREHTYGATLEERAVCGEISFAQARSDPQCYALSSYLGMRQPMKIDLPPNPIRLLQGDRILLMSDGVFSTLTEYELMSAHGFSATEAALYLERKIFEKRNLNQDNFTAILLDYI